MDVASAPLAEDDEMARPGSDEMARPSSVGFSVPDGFTLNKLGMITLVGLLEQTEGAIEP